MRKMFKIVGAILLVFICLFLFLSHYGSQYDESSKDYINKIIPDIISNWDPNLFYNNSNKVLLKEMNSSDMENYMDMLHNKLGNMTNFKGCKGESSIKIMNFHKKIFGEYLCAAEFEKGEAKIAVRIINENDKWSILNFNINSDVFAKELLKEK